MPTTKRETRAAENRVRHDALVAAFEARIAAQDPNDPLTGDPMWNSRHPEYSPNGVRPISAALVATDIPGDRTVPGSPFPPSGDGRRRNVRGATPKQIQAIADRLRTTRLADEPLIARIRAAFDSDEEISFDDARNALDLLFDEPRPNRYDGNCEKCGGNVPAGSGGIKNVSGRWVVFHRGECPEAAATIEVEIAPTPTGPTLDLRSLPAGSRGRIRLADPRHITDPDAADLTRAKIQIDRPTSGKWAGWVFVKDAAEYGTGRRYGKVRPDSEIYEGEVADLLARIVADPENALSAYGKLTSSCGSCDRPLEDEESVRLGIGPICRRKAFGS